MAINPILDGAHTNGETDHLAVHNAIDTTLTALDARAVPAVLKTQQYTQQLLANSTTETSLLSYTIPANTVAAGTVYRIKAGGNLDNIATSGALPLRVRVGGPGGVQVFSINMASAGTTGVKTGWIIDIDVVFRGAASGATPMTCRGFGQIMKASFFSAATGDVSTADMTVDKALTITGQWATADAGNILRLEYGTVELVKA
jgi:hypothetical protein